MASKKKTVKKTTRKAVAKKAVAKKAVQKKSVKKAARKASPKKKSSAKKTAKKKVTTQKASIRKKTAARKTAAKKKAASRPAVKKTASRKKVAVNKTAVNKTKAKKTSAIKKAAGKTAGSNRGRKLTPRERKFQQIRQILLGQRESLLTEAESAMNALPEQTVFPDLGDQATAETDRNFMLRLRGREQRLLNKIDEAIERIDTGAFGICDSCGEEIDVERLRARPVASMCIDCKEEQEEEEKLQAH